MISRATQHRKHKLPLPLIKDTCLKSNYKLSSLCYFSKLLWHKCYFHRQQYEIPPLSLEQEQSKGMMSYLCIIETPLLNDSWWWEPPCQLCRWFAWFISCPDGGFCTVTFFSFFRAMYSTRIPEKPRWHWSCPGG